MYKRKMSEGESDDGKRVRVVQNSQAGDEGMRRLNHALTGLGTPPH